MDLPDKAHGDDDDDDDVRAPRVQADVDALTGAVCVACAKRLCAHTALLSIVLGFRDAPRCAACFAGALGRAEDELLAGAVTHIRHRGCFSRALDRANARPECGAGKGCAFAGVTGIAIVAPGAESLPPVAASTDPIADTTWDAGEMSCGDLVLELRTRLRALPGGSVLLVHATDLAAPVDIPAWCGLTGNTLLGAPSHGRYFVRRKAD